MISVRFIYLYLYVKALNIQICINRTKKSEYVRIKTGLQIPLTFEYLEQV